jgi:hypothetical protein
MKVDKLHENRKVIKQQVLNCFIPFESHMGRDNYITGKQIAEKVCNKLKIITHSKAEEQYCYKQIMMVLWMGFMNPIRKDYVAGLAHYLHEGEARFFICKTKAEVEESKNTLISKGRGFINRSQLLAHKRVEYLDNKMLNHNGKKAIA